MLKAVFALVFVSLTGATPDAEFCADGPGTEWLKLPTGKDRVLSRPIHWAFTCSFPKALKASVREGFNYWERVTGLQLFVEDRQCGKPLQDSWVLVASIDSEFYDSPSAIAVSSLYDKQDKYYGGVITFWKSWSAKGTSKASRETVAAHEVGHMLGMDHDEREECEMYPYVDIDLIKPKTACQSEIDAVRQRYGAK